MLSELVRGMVARAPNLQRVLHGTPRVTGASARKANAEAGLLGVAGFAKAAVLGAVLLEGEQQRLR